MRAYYNEIDPYAAQWLRNLIDAGLIAAGDVDERSILNVSPGDLAGYTQCHFFAGIGGWSLALRLAGWPYDRPVWTGSCPCQPFSNAGERKGEADPRHLWPIWRRLISKRRPDVVFGEQVAAAVGRDWLDLVFADLEREGYSCGASVLPACSVGAPHIRERLWFVAHADQAGRGELGGGRILDGERAAQRDDPNGRGALCDMADAAIKGWRGRPVRSGREDGRQAPQSGRLRNLSDMGDAGVSCGASLADPRQAAVGAGAPVGAPWHVVEWIECRDAKARPVEPGTFPLAHGVPGRVGRLRAYGNAIVPQVAAEFIGAYLDLNP